MKLNMRHVQQQQQQQQQPGLQLMEEEHSTSAQDQKHQPGEPQQQQQEEQLQRQDTPNKRRGRPPGSKNKATLAKAGTAGPLVTFILQVPAGQVWTTGRGVDEERCLCSHPAA
jgi:hypothetical protein